MAHLQLGPCPPRLASLKEQIATLYPDFEEHVTRAWDDLLGELKTTTEDIARLGPDIVPQVEFNDLQKLSQTEIAAIRKRGCVVVRNVVDDSEALYWKSDLREHVKANPDVPGFPPDDKQFYMLYWTKSQVRARSHPNVLAATAWMNNMYHTKSDTKIKDVDLSAPLSYADRFRMRSPGTQWVVHPPHVDGGAIERWEDETYRNCFTDILNGNWRKHDPYDAVRRIDARKTMEGKENQATVFRTYQGWLSLSETAPKQGTLQVFPDVLLGNSYIILRPFFTLKSTEADPLDPSNWKYDVSSSDFPGIYSMANGGLSGPLLNAQTHPNLQLDKTMVSVPKVYPGDMVFWHCDVIHAVEVEHTGEGDSSVMYIPAVPYTPHNNAYIMKQKESFLQGTPPADYPQTGSETNFTGTGKPEDIGSSVGRTAMGFTSEAA